MINAVKDLHAKLIGDVHHTSMQARIFHQLSIIGIIAIPMIILINLSIVKIPGVNTILIATLIMLSALYYNSRVLGNLKSSVVMFIICSNLLLMVNYFYNSGLKGPTLLLFMLCIVFTVALMTFRKSILWVALNVITVAVLLAAEYHNPGLIRNSYADAEGYFIDNLTSYLAIVICVVVVLSYLIKSQQMEKMKAIEASEALKLANDSKTKLLSILSHDLRSPLNSIQGFLEVLNDFDLDQDERKAIKSKLLKETKNTQTMLSNMLSWTKSQMEGGVKVNMITVNLLEVVESCITVQQSAATEKRIGIKNHIIDDIHIFADLDMLKLVVRNLLNNAIKFTPFDGEINLSCALIDKQATLIVQDNGIGLSEDKVKEVFSINSVSTYGTNNEKGVGLGLLLCKEFTELQNGTITLKSNVNQGTTFFITFPTARW